MTRSPALAAAREKMLKEGLAARGICDERVLAAMATVPREAFVPPEHEAKAYEDNPLPIGHGQTISQPFIVAAMAQAARMVHGSRLLDVGTGSGYAAAIAAELGAEVFSIERVAELARTAERALRAAGYGENRVKVRIGDGYAGWPEAAPFHAIIVAATAHEPPSALLNQLAIGGRLVVPVHRASGEVLEVWQRHSAVRYEREELFPVRFVPLLRG